MCITLNFTITFFIHNCTYQLKINNCTSIGMALLFSEFVEIVLIIFRICALPCFYLGCHFQWPWGCGDVYKFAKEIKTQRSWMVGSRLILINCLKQSAHFCFEALILQVLEMYVALAFVSPRLHALPLREMQRPATQEGAFSVLTPQLWSAFFRKATGRHHYRKSLLS